MLSGIEALQKEVCNRVAGRYANAELDFKALRTEAQSLVLGSQIPSVLQDASRVAFLLRRRAVSPPPQGLRPLVLAP